MKKILFNLILLVILSSAVMAQQGEERDKAEFFTGYSGAALFTGDDFEPIDNGFNVAAVYNVHRYIGIKGDVSGTYRNINGDFRSASSPGTMGDGAPDIRFIMWPPAFNLKTVSEKLNLNLSLM